MTVRECPDCDGIGLIRGRLYFNNACNRCRGDGFLRWCFDCDGYVEDHERNHNHEED